MAGETIITIIGNLTADPEMRFTQSGRGVTNFTVASTPRTYDKDRSEWVDGDPMFIGCSLWQQPAENAAESLTKGMRVIVTGRLKSRSYETREGERRTAFEIDVDEVGPSLRYAIAKVTRASTSGERQHRPASASRAAAPASDPWASNPDRQTRQPAARQSSIDDVPPF